MLKLLTLGFILGVATAMGSMLLHKTLGVVFGNWTIWIWPSSIFLLGTAGHEQSSFSTITVVWAVLLNGALYLCIALLLWKVLYRRP